MTSIPITIITGFLGSGKTTLILNLIPQLPKDYRLALLKNEFGDVAIDSQLASSSSISGVKELLNGCICCNLVGQLGDALETLRKDVKPARIIIETSGSAFPATLAMEVNRLGRETGCFALDGVIVVIDVENWKGYEDTSYTAKNASQKAHSHEHKADHQSEVEVLSVTLSSKGGKTSAVNLETLETFLLSAPKDEIYRIKAIVAASRPPASSEENAEAAMVRQGQTTARLYTQLGLRRWNFTPMGTASLPM
ncbi:hypothetical protein G7Y79_00118g101940 [Physcia stellaris]|nr:hypothetical protein G7Y79_00118g101940 [Physcia stellaris]